MISSSQFFKKTLFPFDEDPQITIDKNIQRKSNYKIQTKKIVTNRYSDFSNHEPINLQSINKGHSKHLSSLTQTKNLLKQNYNQIQLNRSNKKYHSSINNNNLQQFSIQVSPWNQNISHTSRQIYDNKIDVNKERQKIKNMIPKYKWSKTIQEKNKQHANFIKSPRNKNNKKINFIMYEYTSSSRSKKNTRKKLDNVIRNIDINKAYQKYLNHQIQFDKSLFKSEPSKSHNHSKKQIVQLKNCPSREGKSLISIEKNFSKQQLENNLKYDLTCCHYGIGSKAKEKLDTSISNEASNKQQDNICHGGRISERKRILQKAKHLKFQNNRRLLKGSNSFLNGSSPLTLLRNINNDQQKPSFQISGNRTRKLQYSFVINN